MNDKHKWDKIIDESVDWVKIFGSGPLPNGQQLLPNSPFAFSPQKVAKTKENMANLMENLSLRNKLDLAFKENQWHWD